MGVVGLWCLSHHWSSGSISLPWLVELLPHWSWNNTAGCRAGPSKMGSYLSLGQGYLQLEELGIGYDSFFTIIVKLWLLKLDKVDQPGEAFSYCTILVKAPHRARHWQLGSAEFSVCWGGSLYVWYRVKCLKDMEQTDFHFKISWCLR